MFFFKGKIKEINAANVWKINQNLQRETNIAEKQFQMKACDGLSHDNDHMTESGMSAH